MARILSVAQLNEYVRRTLASDPMLKGIQLRGEISNFKRHTSGHLYFTLKDEEARIACVMFRSQAVSLRVQPRDGQGVLLRGSVSLYAASGQYQFYVDAIQEEGTGDLHAAFERLKAQLMAEGLFDPGLKRALPFLPRGVGIITSPTGAVVHDIEQVARRRFPGVALYLRPTPVQGDGAAEAIAEAIGALDRSPLVDVIIVGRGGGSLEELWPFNEECVARAIHAASTPIVSAVGHETDFSIADFVADVRAATPSAAAELVVPMLSELEAVLDGFRYRLQRAQAQRVALLHHRLRALRDKLEAHRPDRQIARQRIHLNALAGLMTARLAALIHARRLRLSAGAARMPAAMRALLGRKGLRLSSLAGRLRALSPSQVLARGYALATLSDGRLLTDAAQAHPGERVRVTLRRGTLETEVVRYGDEEDEQA